MVEKQAVETLSTPLVQYGFHKNVCTMPVVKRIQKNMASRNEKNKNETKNVYTIHATSVQWASAKSREKKWNKDCKK